MRDKRIIEVNLTDQLDCELQSENPILMQQAVGDLAKLYGMSTLSRLTGLARPSLYRSLGEHGNPSFQTMCKVLDAMGYTLTIRRKEQSDE